jgi:hypothetical protein
MKESIMCIMPVTHPELLMALNVDWFQEIGEKLGLKPRA